MKKEQIDEKEKIGFIHSGIKLDPKQCEQASKAGLAICREELNQYSPELLQKVYREIICDETRTRNTVRALLALDRMLWLEGRKNETQFTLAAAALATLHVKWKMLKEAGHDV